jgi:calcineurin-like phosphoesterase family protein
MKYWFTADEHYGHSNIIQYCNRPFSSVEEMNESLIEKSNSLVKKEDVVIHLGDFALLSKEEVGKIIQRLNGNHVFLQGSHDRWLSDGRFLLEKTIGEDRIVCCHYPMLSWPRSHHGSCLLHGHTHGRLRAYPGILDVGVDCWNFFPIDWETAKRNLWR